MIHTFQFRLSVFPRLIKCANKLKMLKRETCIHNIQLVFSEIDHSKILYDLY